MNTQAVVARLGRPGFESIIPWMYKDTAGEVTVGIGHVLVNANLAVPLPWRAGDRPATDNEVRIDFGNVQQAPAGKLASYYGALTVVRLAPSSILALCESDCHFFEQQLAKHISCWNDMPDLAQQATLDMAFNLGISKLLDGFPHLLMAIEKGDWVTASQECHRQGIGDERNAEISRLFRLAAG